MTEAQITAKEIQKILSSDYTHKMELVLYEMKRHNEAFMKLKKNIETTSLDRKDEKERTEKLCAEYGYKFGDYLLLLPR